MKFLILLHFEITLCGNNLNPKVVDHIINRFIKWYQSLVRSFDQEKNNIQAHQKKKMTGLPEFKDDTVTDYSRPTPAIESTSDDAQNIIPSVTETEASPSTISPKSFIKFVKANGSPTKSKTNKVEIAKKPPVKYAEQYRKPTKNPTVRGNQRNWNNLKSHQLGQLRDKIGRCSEDKKKQRSG
nr:hypothetical protein [Tanacetum cinerariifolium]